MSAENTKTEQRTRKAARLVTGIVTGDKMDKTRSVMVSRLVKHPLYKKYIRRRTTFKVHDEKNSSRTGDKVVISQTRPLSKTKRWRLVEVVQRGKAYTPQPSDAADAAETTGAETTGAEAIGAETKN